MALQDIPYLTATWTAPASDLTDYVGYFDLSNAPQSWWDEGDSSDGNKMRVAKDDAAEGSTAATELAFEVVNFDDVNQTGQLWFKWSGTLSATSPDDVRIYPPKASATSYGVTNTFGRNAVYTNYHAVWHLNEDPSGTAPQFTDVTGNGRDLTSSGSMTSADQVAGKIGNAIDFDGANDYLRTTTMDFTGTGPCTVQFWNNVLTGDGGGSAFGDEDSANAERLHSHAPFSDDNLYWYYGTPGNTELPAAYTSFYDKWTMIHLIGDEGFQEIFLDGTSQNSASNGATRPTFTTFDIGEHEGSWHDGQIDEFRVSLSIIPDDFISLEYSNQNSVGTFWSSITLDNSGGNVELIPNELSHTHSLDQTSIDITLSGDDLSHTHSLQQSSIPITLSGNGLSHSHSLDQSSIDIILDALDLEHSHSLGQTTVTAAGNVTLIPNDLSHSQSLESSAIDITLLIDGLEHSHNLEAGSIAIVLSPDQLQHSHSLDQSLIQTIELSPADLAHSHTLQAGSIIIQGDATKVSILANELYQVQLSSAKIYKIALKTEELYNVTVTANEIID